MKGKKRAKQGKEVTMLTLYLQLWHQNLTTFSMCTILSKAPSGSEKYVNTWRGKSSGDLSNYPDQTVNAKSWSLSLTLVRTSSKPALWPQSLGLVCWPIFFIEPKFREQTVWLFLPVSEGTTSVILRGVRQNLICFLQWMETSATIGVIHSM